MASSGSGVELPIIGGASQAQSSSSTSSAVGGEAGGEKTNNNKSSAAIEQFLLLAKSARGAAAVELVKQAIESPMIYTFGELLEMPTIHELSTSDNASHVAHYRLLEVFAYGDYRDYLTNSSSLPPLTPSMATKLRHLSIVSLAERSPSKFIAYDDLLRELDMKNLRELEDLIIDVIYANVIQGKMDQQQNRLEIDNTIGRDVRQDGDQLAKVVNVLSNWCRNCDVVLASIETQIVAANEKKEDHVKQKQAIEERVAELRKNVKTTADLDDPMSTDAVNSTPPQRDGMEKLGKMMSRTTKQRGLRGSGSGSRFWNTKH